MTSLAKKMMLAVGAAALMIVGAAAAYYAIRYGIVQTPSPVSVPGEIFAFSVGALAVSSLNVLKVFMIARTVSRVTALGTEGATSGKNIMRLQYSLRLLITGVVLAGIFIAAIRVNFTAIWGAIIGLFTLQIAAFILRALKQDFETEATPAAAARPPMPGTRPNKRYKLVRRATTTQTASLSTEKEGDGS
jgi:hypothetical protein